MWLRRGGGWCLQADEVQVARCELRGANCAKGCVCATPRGGGTHLKVSVNAVVWAQFTSEVKSR